MRPWRGRSPSLAADLLLATTAVVTAAVVVLSATTVAGVIRVVGELERRQLAADCVGLRSSVRSRLRAAGDVLDGVVSSMGSAAEGLNSRQSVVAFEHFDRLVLVSGDGKVVSAYPQSQMRAELPPELRERARPITSFVHLGEDERTGEPVVWAVRRLSDDTGDFAAGRIKTGFIGEAVEQCVHDDPGRVACVFGGEAPVAVAGMSLGQEGDLVFVEQSDPDVPGEAKLGAGQDLGGRWLDITALPGLDWRVAVLEPRTGALRAARAALSPAAVAGVVVSLLALTGAAVSGWMLVAPLRELERRAQRASSGAYVRPLEVTRQDEVGRLSEAINDLTTRLNALHDISRLLTSAARTDQVLDSILAAVAHIAPRASTAVFLMDMVSGDLVAERVPPGSRIEPGQRLALVPQSALGQALAAAGPVALPPGEHRELFEPGATELVAAPLTVRGEAFGLLLLSERQRRLSDAEIETLGTFAAQAAVALRNSRLFEAEYASRLEAEALRDAAEHLANPADLAEALASVRETAGRLLGADATVLAVRDRDMFGLGSPEDADREERLLQVLALAGAGHSGGAIVVEDVEARRFAEPYRDTGVKSLIVVPLTSGGELAGGLGFEYEDGSVWFGEARLGLANTIGKQVSLALANSYLFSQAQRRSANLETIFRISQAVGSSLETKVVLDRVLDVVQKIFSADAVSLMRYFPQRRVLRTDMARGMVSGEILDLERAPGEDVPGEVFESRRPKVIGALDPTEEGLESLAAARGLHALLAVPLLARGRSIGVLCVFSREYHAYHEEDIELLSTFASQAALAIDNAMLYGREHTVATVLQSSILPDKLSAIAGIDAHAVYEPAGREADIGGDYYDLFETSTGRVLVVMCDVCGKGVAAATKTSMVKYSVRALSASGNGPGAILREVNRIISETGDSTHIVTLLVAELDPENDTLTYANGGHPPGLVLLPGSREVVAMPPTGPLLGAVGTAQYAETALDAPDGCCLMAYTDGVTEARRGNRFFGEKRVRRALAAGGRAADVNRRIVSALRRFTPGDLRDDVAILTLRRESGGERPGARS